MPDKLDFTVFLFRYGCYMRSGINTINDDICVPNNIFDKINKIALKSNVHRTFLFSCYATLLLTNSFENKYAAINYRRIKKEDYVKYYELDKPIKDICLSNSQ